MAGREQCFRHWFEISIYVELRHIRKQLKHGQSVSHTYFNFLYVKIETVYRNFRHLKAQAPYEIDIFHAGTRTASNGVTMDFPVLKLQEVVDSYNPQIFRAPAIVSHDTGGVSDAKIAETFGTTNPQAKRELCYGYPDRLKLIGGKLKACFYKLSPKLVQWIRERSIHSISPSFYLPNSPNNPYPGKLTLRHIAFLGKTPPAVKGLDPLPEPPLDWSESSDDFGYVDFNIEDSNGVLNFSMGMNIASPASPWMVAADLFQKYREYLIGAEDLDTAENILPSEEISNLRQMASNDAAKSAQIYELQAEIAELKQAIAELESDSEEYGDEDAEYWKNAYGESQKMISDLQYKMQSMKGGEIEPMYGDCGKKKMVATPMFMEASDYKAAMKEMKMSAADVAEATGIDEDTLKAFISGKGDLSEDEMSDLSKILKLDMGSMKEKMTAKQAEIEYAESQLSGLEAELEERDRLLAEREAALEAKVAQIEYSEISSFVEGLVNSGRLESGKSDRTIHLLLNTPNDTQIEFSEGDIKTPRQELMSEYASRKPWNFSETIVTADEVATERTGTLVPGATAESNQKLEAILSWCRASGKDPDNMADFNEALSALQITF